MTKKKRRPELYMTLSGLCFLGIPLALFVGGNAAYIIGVALVCLGVVFLGLHSRDEQLAGEDMIAEDDDE